MMKRTILISLSALLFLILPSCVDELDVTTTREIKNLVVEGFITTAPGPHEIIISRSAKYGSVFEGFNRRESLATVRIRNSKGEQIFLEELDPGSYFTPAGWQAEVGETYTLLISTRTGARYNSIPETVLKAPELESLEVRYKEQASASEVLFEYGAEVYATFTDPPEEQNFYLWRNNGTYKLESFPENFVVIDFRGNEIPAPKPCCSDCWVTEFEGDPTLRIFKDFNFDGTSNTQLVAFIKDDGYKYKEKYYIRVDQMAISKPTYEFLNLINEQLSITGGIFDPPPSEIKGNILNLDEPDVEAIGYFFAADVSSKAVFLNRDLIPEFRIEEQLNDDCLVIPGASVIRPDYW